MEDNNLRKYAGSQIRRLREDRKMTQDKLAEKLGTVRQAVSKYENGERGVNSTLLMKLCKIFNVPINIFFPVDLKYEGDPNTTLHEVQEYFDEFVSIKSAELDEDNDHPLTNLMRRAEKNHNLKMVFQKTGELDDKALAKLSKIIDALKEEDDM